MRLDCSVWKNCFFMNQFPPPQYYAPQSFSTGVVHPAQFSYHVQNANEYIHTPQSQQYFSPQNHQSSITDQVFHIAPPEHLSSYHPTHNHHPTTESNQTPHSGQSFFYSPQLHEEIHTAPPEHLPANPTRHHSRSSHGPTEKIFAEDQPDHHHEESSHKIHSHKQDEEKERMHAQRIAELEESVRKAVERADQAHESNQKYEADHGDSSRKLHESEQRRIKEIKGIEAKMVSEKILLDRDIVKKKEEIDQISLRIDSMGGQNAKLTAELSKALQDKKETLSRLDRELREFEMSLRATKVELQKFEEENGRLKVDLASHKLSAISKDSEIAEHKIRHANFHQQNLQHQASDERKQQHILALEKVNASLYADHGRSVAELTKHKEQHQKELHEHTDKHGLFMKYAHVRTKEIEDFLDLNKTFNEKQQIEFSVNKKVNDNQRHAKADEDTWTSIKSIRTNLKNLIRYDKESEKETKQGITAERETEYSRLINECLKNIKEAYKFEDIKGHFNADDKIILKKAQEYTHTEPVKKKSGLRGIMGRMRIS